MKKKTIQLVVGIVLLAVAVTALLLLRKYPGDSQEETPATEEIFVLGGIPQPFVKEVTIQNRSDTYRIRSNFATAAEKEKDPAAEILEIVGLDSTTLNQSLLRSIMTTAGNLAAKQVVAQSSGEFATYGLDKPLATINVSYEEGSTRMLLGNDAPGGAGTYAAVGDTVYLLTTSKVTNLLSTRLDFVDKVISPGTPQTIRLQTVTLAGTHFSEDPLVIQPTPEDELAAQPGAAAYRIVSPIQADADFNAGVSALTAVFGLTADKVVALSPATPDGAAAYGLATPYLVVSVTGENSETTETFTLAFSEPDSDGNVYVQNAAKHYIYQVSANALSFLDFTLFDYRNKKARTPFIDSLSEIEVKTPEETYLFALSGEGDGLRVTINGRWLDTKNFRSFYQTLISATYDSPIPPQEETDFETETSSPPPEESEESAELSLPERFRSAAQEPDGETSEETSPDSSEGSEANAVGQDHLEEEVSQEDSLQFIYRYRDGSPEDVVHFAPGPARKSLLWLNDGEAFYTPSLYVDRVLEDLPKLLAGQEVSPY